MVRGSPFLDCFVTSIFQEAYLLAESGADPSCMVFYMVCHADFIEMMAVDTNVKHFPMSMPMRTVKVVVRI